MTRRLLRRVLDGAATRCLVVGSALLSCALALPSVASAQDVAAFYQGRNVDMLVASSPGGGYDAYARTVARHIGRHIP